MIRAQTNHSRDFIAYIRSGAWVNAFYTHTHTPWVDLLPSSNSSKQMGHSSPICVESCDSWYTNNRMNRLFYSYSFNCTAYQYNVGIARVDCPRSSISADAPPVRLFACPKTYFHTRGNRSLSFGYCLCVSFAIQRPWVDCYCWKIDVLFVDVIQMSDV